MSKPKKKPLNYFFYRGDLHKKIHINRPNDIIIAWNYPKGKSERYVYTDVRRNGERAFSTVEVAKMVNRTRRALFRMIADGEIREPQSTYGIDGDRHKYAFYWCEKDIMDLHAYLCTVHIGRPRKDGRVTPKDMPTASELRAMIRQGTLLYVEQDGQFVPTWRANTL
jgi:hypothetical protein